MSNILSLATSQPTYFKDAVNLLSPEPKSKLEAAIRFNVSLQQEQKKLHEQREKKVNEESKGPSISLKSNFSGFS